MPSYGRGLGSSCSPIGSAGASTSTGARSWAMSTAIAWQTCPSRAACTTPSSRRAARNRTTCCPTPAELAGGSEPCLPGLHQDRDLAGVGVVVHLLVSLGHALPGQRLRQDRVDLLLDHQRVW